VGERRKAAADGRARRCDIGVHYRVDPRSELQGIGGPAARFRCSPRRLDCARKAFLIGAQREDDTVRQPSCQLDHTPAGRSDLERHLRRLHLAEPLDSTRDTVSVDLFAAEIGL
jgi:hypothetical protein